MRETPWFSVQSFVGRVAVVDFSGRFDLIRRVAFSIFQLRSGDRGCFSRLDLAVRRQVVFCRPRSIKPRKSHRASARPEKFDLGRTIHTSEETRDVPQRKLGKEHLRRNEADLRVVSLPAGQSVGVGLINSDDSVTFGDLAACSPHPLYSSIVTIQIKGNIEVGFNLQKTRHRRIFRKKWLIFARR
jgi:hypothetical protein